MYYSTLGSWPAWMWESICISTGSSPTPSLQTVTGLILPASTTSEFMQKTRKVRSSESLKWLDAHRQHSWIHHWIAAIQLSLVSCNMAPAISKLGPSANSELLVKDLLSRFLPRKVTATQVLLVMVSSSTCPHLPSLTHWCYRREKSILLTKLRFLRRTKIY